jgi:hypothetical protein
MAHQQVEMYIYSDSHPKSRLVTTQSSRIKAQQLLKPVQSIFTTIPKKLTERGIASSEAWTKEDEQKRTLSFGTNNDGIQIGL